MLVGFQNALVDTTKSFVTTEFRKGKFPDGPMIAETVVADIFIISVCHRSGGREKNPLHSDDASKGF